MRIIAKMGRNFVYVPKLGLEVAVHDSGMLQGYMLSPCGFLDVTAVSGSRTAKCPQG